MNFHGVHLAFPAVVTLAVTRVIVTRMESCISHSKKTNTSAKWFDLSHSDAVEQIDNAH